MERSYLCTLLLIWTIIKCLAFMSSKGSPFLLTENQVTYVACTSKRLQRAKGDGLHLTTCLTFHQETKLTSIHLQKQLRSFSLTPVYACLRKLLNIFSSKRKFKVTSKRILFHYLTQSLLNQIQKMTRPLVTYKVRI